MKSDATIKNRSGLTQQEMAILLKIPVSQWSMYKSGLRGIPAEATKKLNSLLLHLKEEKDISEERRIFEKEEAQKSQPQLQQDYRSVLVKLRRVTKKISALENIRNECFAALASATYLESQKDFLAKHIRERATIALHEHPLYDLTALQMKQQSLELLKNTIEKKIKAEEH
jgi:hypothetical protein